MFFIRKIPKDEFPQNVDLKKTKKPRSEKLYDLEKRKFI